MILNCLTREAQGAVAEYPTCKLTMIAKAITSGPDDEEEEDESDTSGGKGGRY